MIRKRIIIVSVVLLCAVATPSFGGVDRPPNIVFFLADDLGWTGLRCFGSDYYETPNLDRLAQTGMRFTSSYSACTVCSPTRASIMTGMYPARIRLTDFIAGQNRPWAQMRVPSWTKHLDRGHVTIAEALATAGYETLHIGKWHLSSRRAGARDGPTHHGFTKQVLKPREARGYSLPAGFNETGESGSDYLTDYLTDQALQMIDGVRDKPFFLYFAYHTPHTPIQGRSELVDSFRTKVRAGAIHNNPTYAAMVSSLDESVGRVLDRLDRHNIADTTVVIFTSDNGGLTQRYGKHDGFTENKPLRRGKGSAYEGGVRVPTIIRWPGVTRTGMVCGDPIISMDFYPTIVDIAGVSGPGGTRLNFDGLSLAPLLRNPDSKLSRNLYWHYPHYHAGGDGPYSAIRSGEWRLVEFHEDRRVELYNLADDIGEANDLAHRSPDRVAHLRQQLETWRRDVGAQMPMPNPNYDPSRETRVQR